MGIFLRVKCLHFPCKLKEQFQKINTGDASINKDDLFRMCAVAGEEAVFNCVQKYVVYF